VLSVSTSWRERPQNIGSGASGFYQVTGLEGAHMALPSTPPHMTNSLVSSRSSPNPGGSSARSGAGLMSGDHGRWQQRLRSQIAWQQLACCSASEGQLCV
jgi:hypothetical protein